MLTMNDPTSNKLHGSRPPSFVQSMRDALVASPVASTTGILEHRSPSRYHRALRTLLVSLLCLSLLHPASQTAPGDHGCTLKYAFVLQPN